MIVRSEEERDHTAVRVVNTSAFPTPAEAALVDALRRQAAPIISLVGEADGEIVGHIMFSPVRLSARPDLRLMGLAPMAVSPSHQRIGIGSALVREGLAKCRLLGVDAVVVLGHPAYYPRFGFTPASRFGIACEYDAPDEAFMVIELAPGSLREAAGVVQYDPAFSEL